MLFKGNKTKEQQLRRRANQIKGRTVREKFAWQLKEILKVLYKIKELDRIENVSIEKAIDRLRDEYEDQTVTTSEEKTLLYAIACFDDSKQLLDDMMHQVAGASYVPRLQNIINFVADFNNKPYDEYVVFYEATSDKLIDRVKAVTKDVQYKVSRLNYEIAKQSDEVISYEDINVQRIKAMKEFSTPKIAEVFSCRLLISGLRIKAKCARYSSAVPSIKNSLSLISSFSLFFMPILINWSGSG